MVLVPFPAGYILGYAKYFISSIAAFAWGQSLVVLEQMTVILLFFYRYQAVHNVKKITLDAKGVIAFGITLWVANTYFPLTVRMKSEETFKRLAMVGNVGLCEVPFRVPGNWNFRSFVPKKWTNSGNFSELGDFNCPTYPRKILEFSSVFINIILAKMYFN